MMHAAPFVCIRRTFLRKVVSGISILAFRHLGAYTLCLLPSPSSTFFLSTMVRAAVGSDAGTLEIDLERGVEGELKQPILYLTHLGTYLRSVFIAFTPT